MARVSKPCCLGGTTPPDPPATGGTHPPGPPLDPPAMLWLVMKIASVISGIRGEESQHVLPGDQPGGLAVHVHERRSGLLEREDRPGDRLAQANGRQRRRHVRTDRI